MFITIQKKHQELYVLLLKIVIIIGFIAFCFLMLFIFVFSLMLTTREMNLGFSIIFSILFITGGIYLLCLLVFKVELSTNKLSPKVWGVTEDSNEPFHETIHKRLIENGFQLGQQLDKDNSKLTILANGSMSGRSIFVVICQLPEINEEDINWVYSILTTFIEKQNQPFTRFNNISTIEIFCVKKRNKQFIELMRTSPSQEFKRGRLHLGYLEPKHQLYIPKLGGETGRGEYRDLKKFVLKLLKDKLV